MNKEKKIFQVRNIVKSIFRAISTALTVSAFCLILVSCTTVEKKEPKYEGGFFETCFYFSSLPENIGYSHLIKASKIFKNEFCRSRVRSKNIFEMKFHGDKTCFFSKNRIDKKTEEMIFQNEDKRKEYILNAFFTEKNSSVYWSDGRKILRIHDTIPEKFKLPAITENSETDRIVIKGKDSRIIRFKNYLESIEMPFKLGTTQGNKLKLIVEKTEDERFFLIPFFWDKFNFKEIVPHKPGDISIISGNSEKKSAELKMYYGGWEKRKVETKKSNRSIIEIKKSVLNSSFNEEHITAYIFDIKDSYKNSRNITKLYSPKYSGGQIIPAVKLFSSELLIESSVAMSPEDTFMWIFSADGNFDFRNESFMGNLISLKLAKRLYTGVPSFLGGQNLFNRTMNIPFEALRQTLFSENQVVYHGDFENHQYIYDKSGFSEKSAIKKPGKIKGTKAFFGSTENAHYIVGSIVIRANSAKKHIEKAKEILYDSKISVIQEIHEDTGIKDGWASFSFIAPSDFEQKIIKLFDSSIAPVHKTFSLGVYRVGE